MPVSSSPAAPVAAPPEPRSRAPLIGALVLLLVGCVVGIYLLTRERAKDDVAMQVPSTKPVISNVDNPSVLGKTDLPPRRVGSGGAGDPADSTAPKKVKLNITTNPKGVKAVVKLDGNEIGHTPLLDASVSPEDSGKLEISAEGFETETRNLVLDRDASLEVTLNRAKTVTPPHNNTQVHTTTAVRTTKTTPGAGSASTPPPDTSGGGLEIRIKR